MAVAKRAGRIHEDQIQIPFKGQVLESVIEDVKIRAVFFSGQQTGLVTTLGDDNRNPLESCGQKIGFISGFNRGGRYTMFITHLKDFLGVAAAVAS